VATQVLIYRRTYNLGDAVQTVALARLLPGPLIGVYRDSTRSADPNLPFVVNGWLGDSSPAGHPGCLFAGVHAGQRRDEQLAWMRTSTRHIGARDPDTLDWLSRKTVPSELIGCATLTFPRYTGIRSGRYAIDTPAGGDYDHLSNGLTRDVPWLEQWAMAQARLQTLRTAEAVVTSRLHVALPCLAFGTPVKIKPVQEDKDHPKRLSLLNAIGVPTNQFVTMDVSSWAQRYCAWLEAGIGQALRVDSSKEPECPRPAARKSDQPHQSNPMSA
jgi:hypothetical protein